MKKNIYSKIIALIAVISLCFSNVSVFAFEQNNTIVSSYINDSDLSRFVAIVSYFNNLTLNAGGKLTCDGETEVQYGYIAGITIELQQYNLGWYTIKTWSASDSTIVNLSRDWYVMSGYQYRLKLTHTALDNGVLIESFISYSKTITYN